MKELLDKWYTQSQQISPVRICGLDRKRLILYLAEHNLLRGAEIGVDRGRFSEYILQHTNCTLLCVDPWKWRQRGESRYQSTLGRLTPYGNRVIIDRGDSFDAVRDVPDESLDWVYIDGDHAFDMVMTDIIWWARKVKTGGVVAGHDYYRFRRGGVVPAVNVYTQQHNITHWFITDYQVDRTPSWFWLKEPSFVDPLEEQD